MKTNKKYIFYAIAAIAGVIAAVFAYFAFPSSETSHIATSDVETYAAIYYFYSPNCHYCQQIKPFIQEMAQKYPITFCKLENLTTNCKAVAQEIKLRGVPTIVIKNENTTVLFGAKEVLKLEEVLNQK
jgi:thiol-disulfide isomerase/thioredoxin